MTHRSIPLIVNKEDYIVIVRPADTLLSVLRGRIGLTGSKPGCLNGDCGACTVMVEDKPMKSCLMLAIEASNKEVTTIEGLNNSSIQKAFIEHFAFQCGYCTPGFIMNCQSLLNHDSSPSDDKIEEWLKSNICRCTGYEEIESAIKSVISKKE